MGDKALLSSILDEKTWVIAETFQDIAHFFVDVDINKEMVASRSRGAECLPLLTPYMMREAHRRRGSQGKRAIRGLAAHNQ